MRKRRFWLLVGCMFCVNVFAQKKNYRIGLIGFYNLENLYDTIDQPKVNDNEFTPQSAKRYNTPIYLDKINRLAEVISQVGTNVSADGLSVFGVAEVENESVLYDLVRHPKLAARNYKIVHYDSPDLRGIDVGLLYNPKYFLVLQSHPIAVPTKHRTRDVLWVSGIYSGDTVHIFVNHWPSRRGGEETSAPQRAIAAAVPKKIIDSLTAKNPSVKYIVMGDLNDDPVNVSVTKVLGAKGNIKNVREGEMFNPWFDFYKKGIGTLAYNDAWNLFDQIIISYGFLNKRQSGWFYRAAHIFKRDFMLQKTGRYQGYPLRTWTGNIYNYGYSDHFPTYIELLKPLP